MMLLDSDCADKFINKRPEPSRAFLIDSDFCDGGRSSSSRNGRRGQWCLPCRCYLMSKRWQCKSINSAYCCVVMNQDSPSSGKTIVLPSWGPHWWGHLKRNEKLALLYHAWITFNFEWFFRSTRVPENFRKIIGLLICCVHFCCVPFPILIVWRVFFLGMMNKLLKGLKKLASGININVGMWQFEIVNRLCIGWNVLGEDNFLCKENNVDFGCILAVLFVWFMALRGLLYGDLHKKLWIRKNRPYLVLSTDNKYD